ncbi:hypothetical protein ACHAPD_004676 [Fusarium lateritium]
MTSDEDQELLVLRRFNEISARNLLCLQCELLALEKELRKWDERGFSSGKTSLEQAAETWEIMVEQADSGTQKAKNMTKLVKKLRLKMKEYYEALDLQSRIDRLQHTNRRALEVARNKLDGGPAKEDGSKPNPILGGEAKTYLDDEGDLVSLGAPKETDMLFKTLRAYWPETEEVSRNGIRRISRFEERSITIAVAIINIVVAIILLVGSITSLYFVSSPAAILGMISAFTVAFALSVGLMTNAKRAEIFAGSAAFAAVLVVFVSSGDLSGNCCQEK